MERAANNARIAKNALLLGFRLIITMSLSLYTSRVTLNTLGVEDFGIYNVVGGVVIVFSFINSAMAASTQRFLNFAIGKKQFSQIQVIFSMGINIHLLFCLIILILSETIGLWFLNNYLVIAPYRIDSAILVYQLSVFSTLVAIFTVPFNSAIIAYERMKAFAYISTLESLLKLIAVSMLAFCSYDKLELYAIFIFLILIFIQLIYILYCKFILKECSYCFIWNKQIFKEMLGFASWNFLGAASGMMVGQGINILLNIFFGTTINAARAIALQIQGAVNGFVINFMLAVSPQIVKSYAENDKNYMFQLVFLSSKYSFFLLHLLTLPILIQTESILTWWLKIVPDETIIFTRLSIIYLLTVSLTYSINMASQATGNIRMFQTVEGAILLLNFPISYFLLRNGYPPSSTFVVMTVLSGVALFARLAVLYSILSFPVTDYIKKVIFKVIIVFTVSTLLTYFVYIKAYSFDKFYQFLFILLTSFISIMLAIWIFGSEKNERKIIKMKLSDIVEKNFNIKLR
jgi:O-antigen/teichoic acid export membrane protein